MKVLKKNFLQKSIGLALMSSLALATHNASAEDADPASQLDEVETIQITGSRISRTSFEGVSPVVQITSQDMANAGYVTFSDVMKNLTQNSGNTLGAEASNGFAPNAETVDLRGFGPGYTLTLINGRRLANYPAAVDTESSVFNAGSIPVAAIERVEILSSGASAIYGSDAVAGVINIILKKHVENTTVSAMVGAPTQGEGDTFRIQAVTGSEFANGRGSFTASAEYQKRDPVKGNDRSWLNNSSDYPNGEGVMPRGIATLDYWSAYGLAVNPGDLYVDPTQENCELTPGMEYSSREGFGNYCGYNNYKNLSLRNGSEKFSIFASSEYEIDSETTLFLDATAFKQNATNDSGALVISDEIADFDNMVDTYWGTMPSWTLTQRYFGEEEIGKGKTEGTFEELSHSFSIGVRGLLLNEYDYEVSFTDSRYKLDQTNAAVYEEMAGPLIFGNEITVPDMETSPFGTPWYDGQGSHANIFSPLSQAEIDQLIGQSTQANNTKSQLLAASISGDLFELPTGTVKFAAIAEYQKESFELRPDERLMNDEGMGWKNLTGYAGKGDRDRTAVGVEILIPLDPTFELTVAGRYDKYDSDSSAVGGAFTPQVGFTYRPMEEVLVRGNWSESFKAPDMNYIYTDTTFYGDGIDYSTCAEEFIADNGGSVTNDQFQAWSNGKEDSCWGESFLHNRNGSKELKDERGKSFNLGVVVSPMEGLSMTLDYYDLEINNQVKTESTRGLLLDEFNCTYGSMLAEGATPTDDRCNYTSERIVRGGDLNYIQNINASPVNKAMYRQIGLDANIEYAFSTQYGEFTFATNWTHTLDTETQLEKGGEIESIRDAETNTQPRSKTNMSLTHSHSGLTTTLTAFRTGSVSAFNPFTDPEGPVRNSAFYTYNLSSMYELNESSNIRLSITNVFDQRPDADSTFAASEWPWYDYTVYSGAGVGREIYMEVSHTF